MLDIYDLFKEFDSLYFEGVISPICTVEWSDKLMSTAGVFCANRKVIRLNRWLHEFLDLKALKETLLHEMIHAYIYLLNLDSSTRQHSKVFLTYMNRINQYTGLNITIRHSYSAHVKNVRYIKYKTCNICKFTFSARAITTNKVKRIHSIICRGVFGPYEAFSQPNPFVLRIPTQMAINIKDKLLNKIRSFNTGNCLFEQLDVSSNYLSCDLCGMKFQNCEDLLCSVHSKFCKGLLCSDPLKIKKFNPLCLLDSNDYERLKVKYKHFIYQPENESIQELLILYLTNKLSL